MHYCAKECQKLDWKRHKPQCTTVDKVFKQEADINRQVALTFLEKNYVEIMSKMLLDVSK